nr:crooked neck-like protein 1 [Tanacetum cinerariifolium]
MWLLAAQLETKQSNLSGARAILGKAIGLAPKYKIFKKYIEMELRLVNINCCRKLYKTIWSCYAWCKDAELERSLNETERARAIFELTIAQPALYMPELLWKEYIGFEIAEGEFERTRQPYGRLLVQQQGDVLQEQRQLCIRMVRRVFENAIDYYKTSPLELKEERVMLLQAEWFRIECGFGELGDTELVPPRFTIIQFKNLGTSIQMEEEKANYGRR